MNHRNLYTYSFANSLYSSLRWQSQHLNSLGNYENNVILKTPCALWVISLTRVCSWCQGLFWITSEGAIKFQMWNKAGWKLFPDCHFDFLLAVFPTVYLWVALSWQGRLLMPFSSSSSSPSWPSTRAPLPKEPGFFLLNLVFLATIVGFGGSGSWL